MSENELDSIHEKLDRHEVKIDKILDKLESHHGRLASLETMSGMVKTGLVIIVPLVIKCVYDLIRSLPQ